MDGSAGGVLAAAGSFAAAGSADAEEFEAELWVDGLDAELWRGVALARGAAAAGFAACCVVVGCGVVGDGWAPAACGAGRTLGDWVALAAAVFAVGETLAFGGTRVAVGCLGT